ncbi:MAG: hypothetical protein ACYTEW_22645 [Planctomycetota bacterium]|jgi:hypothetical protein
MPEDYVKIIYDDEWNIIGVQKWFPDTPIPPDPPDPPQEEGEIIYFSPSFELGASSADPSLGTGGALAWYTREEFTNGTRINLGMYIHSVDGSSGIGTGSYEVYIPDALEPAEEYFSDHANLWVAGGGISEFDGSVKWTMRNEEKGPKLIFTFNGKEWNQSWPKNFADFKLRASIEYYL